MFQTLILRTRSRTPSAIEIIFVDLLLVLNLLNNFTPKDIPRIVENSAIPFMMPPTKSPLLIMIPRQATVDVIEAEDTPKSRKDMTIGTPVKSNLRNGIHGNGIFKPENFNE